jgi:hypothetical protein
MLKLLDGPVEGVYMCKRAPLFLRAVVDSKSGEKDVLNQLDDKPKATEQVFVYQRVGESGWVHLKMTKRSQSGFYALGEYRYLQSVYGEGLREETAWRQWVSGQLGGKVNLETGEMTA